MASSSSPLPKMMLGFVVRRCATALGRAPSPEELAEWANNYREGGRTVYLFGRKISPAEARLILRYPSRPVTARGARPAEQSPADCDLPPNVVRLPDPTRRRGRRAGR
ncbi:hypothetical protein L6Q96_18325 [Candidatus Binatia bacterium]|nr:hypothetical protein [Candidatus Binatia bacterium]